MTAAGQRIATGFALSSAASLLVLIIWAADRNHPPSTAAPPVGDVVRVGVVEGQTVPGYLKNSRGELASLTPGAPTWALVSLTGYVPPAELSSVLSGGAVAQVYARAPLPESETRVVRISAYRVPDDVVAGMLATAGQRDQERADYGRLSQGLRGAGNDQERLRRAYDDAASTAAAEAHAYRAHCACVFAAVVQADPAALRGIAGRAEVRAVDPAPEVRRLDRVEFRPPLPEQSTSDQDVDRQTAISPAPGGTSTVAAATPTPVPSSLGATVKSASPPQPAVPSAGPGSSLPSSEESPAVPAEPAPTSPPGASATAAGEPGGASAR
ncbi:hypothetical protein [Actinoplanes sp. NPDC049265]|uniref:hypothetical protein n=1 Tax=Actinoplanes sp. NPDC049265 TaxID=3363902 RepID=UPI00372236E4